ncbi:MAG: excisionase family DNA-binding protein, partial [Ignavibacteriales bacterium]
MVEKRYISISEASLCSGLSKWTLYKKSARRELPMLKVGTRVLLPKEDFERWLEN